LELSLLEILIALFALLLAGFAKGISGMGLPAIATPILAVLFDLQTAIAITIFATFVTDVIMLARIPKSWGLIKKAGILMIFGICGIVAGSLLLVNINQSILTGILALVILAFVVTSYFSLLPSIQQRRSLDCAVGLGCGILQGAAGASGPIISMYLLQMKLKRNEFLFLLNCFFAMVDLTQCISVYQLGLYKGEIPLFSLLSLVPVLTAMALGMFVQKKISDRLFRNAVLCVMTVSGLVLLCKSFGVL